MVNSIQDLDLTIDKDGMGNPKLEHMMGTTMVIMDANESSYSQST